MPSRLPIPNERKTETLPIPTTPVVASVVMCGCPVLMPFGWCLVWRPVLHPVPVARRPAAALADPRRENFWLN